MKRRPLNGILAAALIAGTTPALGAFKLYIPPVRFTGRVKRIAQIMSVSQPSSREENRRAIASRMNEVTEDVRALLRTQLSQRTSWEVPSDTEAARWSPELGDWSWTAPPSPATLGDFSRRHEVDAVFCAELTDYGKTPAKWERWIWTGTALWVAGAVVVAYNNPNLRPFVGIYVAQEVVEEGSEAYFGSSLFGSSYKPVRLRAMFIGARDGRVLWRGVCTATAGRKYLKNLPKGSRKKKEVKLEIAARRAVEGLADKFLKALRNRPGLVR